MNEISIYHDGRHVYDSHSSEAQVTAHAQRDESGRFFPKMLTFTSHEGESFAITIGEKYTIRYMGKPLEGIHGLVSSVTGTADYIYDEEAQGNLLVLQDAKISYTHYRGPVEKPTTLHVGYIPGVEILHDTHVVFAWKIPHLQPVEHLTPAVQVPALSS